ncbi:hypothetical protein GOP47_0010669 [Adiantum capillus-veneris]|uniref:AT-hook motif nuclear-localized protein n=1 Tax=Adiantum capillus-veneris TaxID=13818 RepID=A0A9D4ZGK2_ADICA|nr:hypothetical protein GOP47_0010669 [Adiantum capillus-veneris]
MIHSPAPLRQMSPSPNFNPGPGPNLNPSPSNMNPSSSSGMSVCYPPETPPHMMPHQVQTGSPPSGVGGSMSPGSAMVPRPTSMCKKKRGRPRKYAADVNGSAALVIPLNSAPAAEKKGGGRGPSKKTQSLTTGATGHGFTPHVLTVGAGEDVTAKIMTFSQHGPWAVCILSANGAISNASLSHDGLPSSTVTYEGRFEILSLSGLFLLTEDGATRSRSGGFSVSLAGQDGRVIGGRVAGLLIAATPIQVVVGTFFPESRKAQAKAGSLEGLCSRTSRRTSQGRVLCVECDAIAVSGLES